MCLKVSHIASYLCFPGSSPFVAVFCSLLQYFTTFFLAIVDPVARQWSFTVPDIGPRCVRCDRGKSKFPCFQSALCYTICIYLCCLCCCHCAGVVGRGRMEMHRTDSTNLVPLLQTQHCRNTFGEVRMRFISFGIGPSITESKIPVDAVIGWRIGAFDVSRLDVVSLHSAPTSQLVSVTELFSKNALSVIELVPLEKSLLQHCFSTWKTRLTAVPHNALQHGQDRVSRPSFVCYFYPRSFLSPLRLNCLMQE